METTRPSGSDTIVADIVEARPTLLALEIPNTRAIRAQAKSLDALGEVMAKRPAAPLVGPPAGAANVGPRGEAVPGGAHGLRPGQHPPVDVRGHQRHQR